MNCPITADDAKREIDICDQDRKYLQEKTTWHTPQHVMVPSIIPLPLAIQNRHKM